MKHTYTSLMRRLARSGFKKEFVRRAILPDWWDDACTQNPDLLPDIELRVARFLGLPLSVVRDPATAIVSPAYPGAQLRRVRDLDRDRMTPAIHSAMRIAAAVVRSMRDPTGAVAVPPPDGLAWREEIGRSSGNAITLADIVDDLWRRGIPVVPLDTLPAPSFQGMACIVAGRPVILMGHKHDQPGRIAFILTHEAGHIAAGDCTPDHPVVDEEDEVSDDAEMESRADSYATRVLIGDSEIPKVDGANFKELASSAYELERTGGANASMILFAWASRTRDYATAVMAVKALYRGSGARRQLRRQFDLHVDLDAASESDRALLHCVYGEVDQNAAVD